MNFTEQRDQLYRRKEVRCNPNPRPCPASALPACLLFKPPAPCINSTNSSACTEVPVTRPVVRTIAPDAVATCGAATCPQENDRGDDKIRQLIDTLDLRKDEAIERTFKGVAKQFRDIFAQVERCCCVSGQQGVITLALLAKASCDGAL